MKENKPTILYVDDDEGFLLVARKFLEFDYNVVTSNSVKDALSLIDDHRPDIIVSDMTLDDKSGYDLLEIVAERFGPNPIPFVFATAREIDFTKYRKFESYLGGYLVKPFSIKDLLSLIRKLLHET